MCAMPKGYSNKTDTCVCSSVCISIYLACFPSASPPFVAPCATIYDGCWDIDCLTESLTSFSTLPCPSDCRLPIELQFWMRNSSIKLHLSLSLSVSPPLNFRDCNMTPGTDCLSCSPLGRGPRVDRGRGRGVDFLGDGNLSMDTKLI